MAANLQMASLKIILKENCNILTEILKFAVKVTTDNNAALVKVMAWHREDTKPLPEPMITQFDNAYMHH